MSKDFEQISLKQGFMKHNGGLLFKTISENEYQFKTVIKENHLNAAGITHGGFIAAVVDAGAGTAAHRAADNSPCVTISLELKFISVVKLGQELIGTTKKTVLSIRKKNYWNFNSLAAKDPVATNLCSQLDLQKALERAHILLGISVSVENIDKILAEKEKEILQI